MSTDRLRTARVHLDRAPAGWVIAVGAVLAQLGVAVAALAHATLVGTSPIPALLLVGWSVLGALLAAPAIAALARGWRPVIASGALLAVAALVVVVTAGYPPAALVSVGLLIATLRVWIAASVDAVDIAAVDPDRLERIDAPADGPAAKADDGPA
ncbi:MAG: hypothetical protein ABEJ86_06305, partial [Halococcoides sp.]